MTKFQNMKIEINEQQPLDDVVRELIRLGYKPLAIMVKSIWITCRAKGDFVALDKSYPKPPDHYNPTTLAELKEMK